MKCPSCRFENREGAHFCGECGARLSTVCPQCGAGNPPAYVFCDRCGFDLGGQEVPFIDYDHPRSYTPKPLADKILISRRSIEGERKLVTVLFADVANYTSMSEKLDPEEVHRIMGGCFRVFLDEVHRYEGTVDKFTGDGVMALFGAPLAHEDHAQRACYAALSTRKAMAEYGEQVLEEWGLEFKIRIGINSGTVIVGSVGDDLKMDYTAIGDTTNLASRIEGIARPGTILVSGQTQGLAKGFFEFRPLGKVPLKGKEESQEVYELVKAGDIETRIEAAAAKGLTRFVGREREIKALDEVLEKARSGAGQVVGIVGDAGVGKSRLLLEFRKRLPGNEYVSLAGRCLHYGTSLLYVPILDILKGFFDIQEGEPERSMNRKVVERLGRLDGRLLPGLPSLQEVLSLKVENDAYLQIDPQQRRQMTFRAIRDLLIRASMEKPLVLSIEDLHWIDRTSQEFLDFFAESLGEAPILILLLYRPEYVHRWGDQVKPFEIPLDQLSPKRSSELVRAVLKGGQVVPEVKELVLARAGGNPLFVEELIFSLMENGTIQRRKGRFVLGRKASQINVPDTVKGIIGARMDRVDENQKRVLQVASVIGREFRFSILHEIMGSGEDLEASLLHLQKLEFVYETQRFPELEFVFKHGLTQEVAYGSLLFTTRRELHEKVGEAIEGLYTNRLEEFYELLAYHYVRSDNTAKAVAYLDLANRKAVNARAMEDAKTYFDKAMGLLDTLPETEEKKERRISLVVNQHLVFFFLLKLTEYQEILARYESMAAGLQDRELQGAFYACVGYWEFSFGHLNQAIETATKAVELCEAAGYPDETGVAYFTLATAHLWRGDYERVLALKERALRMKKGGFHLRNYVRPLLISSYACTELGRWDEAVELGQKALSTAQDFSDNGLTSWAGWTISLAYTGKRDIERAVEYGEISLAAAHTPGDKLTAQAALALARCHTGEPEKGIETLVGLIAVSRAAGFVSARIPHTGFLAEGYRLAGDSDKAAETAQELLELAEKCGARGHVGKAHRLLGEVALKTDSITAGPHFDRAISIFREKRAENELALAYVGMGRWLKQQDDLEQARDYLTQALDIFERLGTMVEPDKVRKELAALPPP